MLRRNIRSSVFVLLALAACTSKNNVKITGEIKDCLLYTSDAADEL